MATAKSHLYLVRWVGRGVMRSDGSVEGWLFGGGGWLTMMREAPVAISDRLPVFGRSFGAMPHSCHKGMHRRHGWSTRQALHFPA